MSSFSIGKSLYFYKSKNFVYQEKLSSPSLGPSEVFQAAYLDAASHDSTSIQNMHVSCSEPTQCKSKVMMLEWGDGSRGFGSNVYILYI